MSARIPTAAPAKIYIKWGQIRGLKTVQKELHAALIRAFKRAVRDTQVYMVEIVPESSERSPPYPVSYQSEALLDTALDILQESLAKLAAGSAIKRLYTVKYGYPASYARYVNYMRNPNWSKATSQSGFYGKAKQFLIAKIREYLRLELQRPRAQKLQLTKYIGSRKYG